MDAMHTLTFISDDDDERDIRRAIARFQATRRWPDKSGIMVTDGESELSAAILGEICRDWLEAH